MPEGQTSSPSSSMNAKQTLEQDSRPPFIIEVTDFDGLAYFDNSPKPRPSHCSEDHGNGPNSHHKHKGGEGQDGISTFSPNQQGGTFPIEPQRQPSTYVTFKDTQRGLTQTELDSPSGVHMPSGVARIGSPYNPASKRRRASIYEETPRKAMKTGSNMSNPQSVLDPDGRGRSGGGELVLGNNEMAPGLLLSVETPASSISSLSPLTTTRSPDSGTSGIASTAVSPINNFQGLPYSPSSPEIFPLSPNNTSPAGIGDILSPFPSFFTRQEQVYGPDFPSSRSPLVDFLDTPEVESINEFLEGCFDKPGDKWRKEVLERIRASPFLREQILEPVNQGTNDPYTKGHGKKDLSIYEVFVEGSSKEGWRCLLGSEQRPCKAKVVFKRFERAMEHIRSHLDHRPFKCYGKCGVVNCQRSFFAQQYLRDHVGRKDDTNCKYCNKIMRTQNLSRHYLFCRKKEGCLGTRTDPSAPQDTEMLK
ncbi:hypothetical protein CPB86DRAFT_326071 [Serendipita vermifera]|nr:hypothetical protein CPB86DRAFT_326071 [Serendipita vermifera]